jgi:hypothetical protein
MSSAFCQSLPRHLVEQIVHLSGIGLHAFVDPPLEQREEAARESVGLGGSPLRIECHACRLKPVRDGARGEAPGQYLKVMYLPDRVSAARNSRISRTCAKNSTTGSSLLGLAFLRFNSVGPGRRRVGRRNKGRHPILTPAAE